MPDDFFELSADDRKDAFDFASQTSGRPPQLLEKDVWVVWTLRALFESHLAADLTFKGGTSLSKVYRVIDRFSEDIDLTYDIRKLLPTSIAANGMPPNRSQAGKWSELVGKLLPDWVEKSVVPILQAALDQNPAGNGGSIDLQGDKLYLHYPYLTDGLDYVSPAVLLEFGGRATGEPNTTLPVQCDIADHHPERACDISNGSRGGDGHCPDLLGKSDRRARLLPAGEFPGW